MSLIRAIKWSFLSELAAKAIQPVVLIVLARLLTAEDFGVMTAAMMVIAFSQIFWEAGMGKALIQRKTHIEEAANSAFMVNIVLGALIASLLYLLAKPIAQTIFQDERVTAVLQVMTLQVLLGAFSSVQTALLQKEMGFKKLFWVRFTTVSLPGLASIPLAWNGYGYWALVAGALVGQFAQAIMLWRMSHWRPKMVRSIDILTETTGFGAWVSLSGILGWYYNWVDSLFLSKYLGLEVTGNYRIGSQFVATCFALIFSPIIPVVYSQLSRNGVEANKRIVEVIPIVSIWLAVPIGGFLFLESENLTNVLFGSKWTKVAEIITLIAVVQAIGYFSAFNGELYRAKGLPKLEALVWLLGVIIYTPSYYFLVNNSFELFLYGRVVLVAIFYFLHIWLYCRIADLDFLKICRNQLGLILVFLFCGVIIYLSTLIYGLDGWLSIVLTGSMIAFSLLIVFYIFERKRGIPMVLKLIKLS